jgi:ribosome-binding factor A
MESKRQQKFARLIQKDLSDIFQKEMKTLIGNAFVTVADVKMTPDLSIARIYLSFMLAPSKNMLLEDIRESSNQIRKVLGNKIRNQARIVPELEFFIDDTAEYAAKIDALFASIEIPPLKEGEVIGD